MQWSPSLFFPVSQLHLSIFQVLNKHFSEQQQNLLSLAFHDFAFHGLSSQTWWDESPKRCFSWECNNASNGASLSSLVSNNTAKLIQWHFCQANQLDVPILLKLRFSETSKMSVCQTQLAPAKRFKMQGGGENGTQSEEVAEGWLELWAVHLCEPLFLWRQSWAVTPIWSNKGRLRQS